MNQALDAIQAHFATSPDAAVAAHLINGLRALAARNPAGTIAPRTVINLTADRPRPVTDDRSAAALRSEIATAQRDLRRAIDNSQQERAESLGVRITSLQQRLAERTALEAERPELAEADPVPAIQEPARPAITIDPNMSLADLRQRLAVVSQAWSDAMERAPHDAAAHDLAARFATERNLLTEALAERSRAEPSPFAAMPIRQLYDRMVQLQSTITREMLKGSKIDLESMSRELVEMEVMLERRKSELSAALAAAAAPVM